MAAASTISLTFESWPEGIQGTAAIHERGIEQNRAIERKHTQAAQKEEAEEGEMAVRHVSDLVAKHCGDLDRAQRLDQRIGKEDVAKPGKNSGHAGIDHEVSRCPTPAGH